jgi:Fic family protein
MRRQYILLLVTDIEQSTYRPIQDLPPDWAELEVRELRSLDLVWREQRERLNELDELVRLRERLVRSWAIETGVLERVYSIDRGVTEILVAEGLKQGLLDGATDRDPAEVIAILRDHQEAIEGVFDFVAGRRDLSTSYIKEVHALLTRNQRTVTAIDQFGRTFETELRHGDWKMQPNNPRRADETVHAYSPPEHVAAEMDLLIELHAQHCEVNVPPEIEAAWLHHRFTQIHPFQDGNGRVARALASLVYLREGWFPLSIHRDQKSEYIDALEAADAGDLSQLTQLFGGLAKDALLRALSVGDQSERELQGVRQLIGAVRDRMLGTAADTTEEELDRARAHAERLREVATARFERVKSVIDEDITSVRPNFSCQIETAAYGDPRIKWYRASQIRIAQQEFHYFANLGTYASWARLRLNDFDAGTRHDIVICFHGMGREFRGLIAGVAFYERAESREEDDRMVQAEQQVIQEDLFQLNHRETEATAEERFADWAEYVVAAGLAAWERGVTGA